MEQFIGSPKRTLGLEMEIQLLDKETYDLTPRAEELLEKCLQNGIERVKTEIHQSMLEVDTEIGNDVKEIKNRLAARMDRVWAISEEMGTEISVMGTHPFQKWSQRLISNTHRYHYLHEKYRWMAKRMNVYGLHIHVGVRSPEEAFKVMRNAAKFLPHLLALSANSPYWHGSDTGMQSSRYSIMSSFPYAGAAPMFETWGETQDYITALKSAGAIASMKDLYWFIRPNFQFGTVEFRICDVMPTLEETMSVVALMHALTSFILDDDKDTLLAAALKESLLLPENLWIAARDGLDGEIITNLDGQRQKISEGVLHLKELLAPTAKRINCFEELEGLDQLLKKKTGADRQRELYESEGCFKKVISSCSKNFRESLGSKFKLEAS